MARPLSLLVYFSSLGERSSTVQRRRVAAWQLSSGRKFLSAISNFLLDRLLFTSCGSFSHLWTFAIWRFHHHFELYWHTSIFSHSLSPTCINIIIIIVSSLIHSHSFFLSRSISQEVQVLKALVLGEEERGQSQYQVMCFLTKLQKGDFISSDAMAKLRQVSRALLDISLNIDVVFWCGRSDDSEATHFGKKERREKDIWWMYTYIFDPFITFNIVCSAPPILLSVCNLCGSLQYNFQIKYSPFPCEKQGKVSFPFLLHTHLLCIFNVAFCSSDTNYLRFHTANSFFSLSLSLPYLVEAYMNFPSGIIFPDNVLLVLLY